MDIKVKDIIYADFVESLAKRIDGGTLDLVHFAMGVCGEAGELLDAVKKHWAYEQELDVENVIEELGDLEFYMQAIRNRHKITREQVLEYNIDKLMERYPAGVFTTQHATERADKS